jgi:hypothetical protein
MNLSIEVINPSARIDLAGRSYNFGFYLSVFYPCSSACIRGSKELSGLLK